MFDEGFGYPIFTPFVNKIIVLPRDGWIVLEIAAIIIVGIVSILVKRKESTQKSMPNQ